MLFILKRILELPSYPYAFHLYLKSKVSVYMFFLYSNFSFGIFFPF